METICASTTYPLMSNSITHAISPLYGNRLIHRVKYELKIMKFPQTFAHKESQKVFFSTSPIDDHKFF